MLSELFSFIYGTICLTINVTMTTIYMARLVPPLVADFGALLAISMYLTRLKRPPGEGRRLPNPGVCIAHRGAGLDAPENTMAAFKNCVAKGCKYIEFDVRTTKDGVPMVWHDPQVGGKCIAGHTWEQLRNIRVSTGHPMEEKFDDARLCTLSEVAEYLNSAGVHMIIDIKSFDVATCVSVANLFTAHPHMRETCFVTSFNPVSIYRVRRIDPRIAGAISYQPYCFSAFLYTSTTPMRIRHDHSRLMHYASRVLDGLHAALWWSGLMPLWTGSSVLLINKEIASPSLVNKLRKKGYEVAVWTVNQPLEKRMISRCLGVPYLTDTLVGDVGTPNGTG